MSNDNGNFLEGAFCRTTFKSLLTENKDFWKLLHRNFIVSFDYLSDFIFWFLVVNYFDYMKKT